MLKELLRALYAIVNAIKAKSEGNDGGNEENVVDRDYAVYVVKFDYNTNDGTLTTFKEVESFKNDVEPWDSAYFGLDLSYFDGKYVSYVAGQHPVEYGFDGDNFVKCNNLNEANDCLTQMGKNTIGQLLGLHFIEGGSEALPYTNFQNSIFYINSFDYMYVVINNVAFGCKVVNNL